ncbi:MAG: carboxylesterase family protein [Acidimicrobiales bacterium]
MALRCADASASGNRVTFLYRFDFPTTSFGGVLGATHGCDIPFILDTLDSPMTMHDPSDPTTQHLATVWSGAICAFARTGSPNLDGLPRWPEYSPEAAPSMILDAKPSVGQCVDELRLSLWGDRE